MGEECANAPKSIKKIKTDKIKSAKRYLWGYRFSGKRHSLTVSWLNGKSYAGVVCFSSILAELVHQLT